MSRSLIVLATIFAMALWFVPGGNAQELPSSIYGQAEAGKSAGLAAYKAGDYAEAFRIWDKQARAGNAAAAYNMGILYANGKGVTPSQETAFAWFKYAADLGDIDGQVRTGRMYMSGQGVERSEAKAKPYLEMAAAEGSADADNYLGLIAISLSNDEAIAYWERAAKKDHEGALTNLTLLYGREGFGAFDAQKAIYWGKRAEAAGSARAKTVLAELYAKGYASEDEQAASREKLKAAALAGDVVALAALSETERSLMQIERLSILEKKAKQGDARAQWELGNIYWTGAAGEQSDAKAVDYYQQAMRGGDPNAYDALGRALLVGRGIERDEALGVSYLKHSAQLGQPESVAALMVAGVAAYWEDANYALSFRIFSALSELEQTDAHYLLARHYEYGQGVAGDAVEAERLYRKAASEGNPFAAHALGMDAEFQGRYEEARRFYQKAADAGYSEGFMGLAGLHAAGRGVSKDLERAAALYDEAARLGNDQAATWASIERSHARRQRENATGAVQAQVKKSLDERRKERHLKAIEAAEAEKSRSGMSYSGGPELTGWRKWLVGFAGGSSSGGGYSSGSSGSSHSGSSSGSGYQDPYGGLNPWSRDYQQRRAISNPVSYYQNTYKY
ncbi:MAG: sel1 repeat family protein [Nitratireductor sp.]|nr:sel1 repeat family protein [Nitratireductor sp.]